MANSQETIDKIDGVIRELAAFLDNPRVEFDELIAVMIGPKQLTKEKLLRTLIEYAEAHLNSKAK